jgi:hypothetical protein
VAVVTTADANVIVSLAAVEVEGTHHGRPVRLLVCPVCWSAGGPLTAFRRIERQRLRDHLREAHGSLTLDAVVAL